MRLKLSRGLTSVDTGPPGGSSDMPVEAYGEREGKRHVHRSRILEEVSSNLASSRRGYGSGHLRTCGEESG